MTQLRLKRTARDTGSAYARSAMRKQSNKAEFPPGKGMDLWSEVSITSITILKEYPGDVAQGGVAQAALVSSLQWLPYMEVTAYVVTNI